MTQPVNWGILGAAKFAREHMGPAIHAARGGRLAALATSSTEKAAGFQDFAPDCRVHDSYEAMLADPGIDAVYIPLPNHLHVEWATKAAEAGKHVLCEKPIAMRAAEIDELILTRDRTGVLLAEAYMIVHHPQWQQARELVQGGAIGRLVRVDADFSYMNQDPDNIRNQAGTGGGGLRDIGVYIFGGARFVTGEEPKTILSHDIDWENGVDTRAHVTARFPSFHYTGMVSMRMAPFQEVTFHGTEGVLRLTTPFNAQVYDQAEIVLRHAQDGIRIWRFPRDNHYVRQVEAFNASVRGGAEYPCPLEFVRGTQVMIDMVLDAAG
ncbi:Gfo/Idh/MocA family oxidoreductase [Aestuariicoccus sp. MJ-SS9]|uniref:Gfo/Idh/MocA family protein n=1 Tax=Aestuariicoccus sp. MJ-SS9 TaxID=3079855 RepID=UPI00290F30E4|nr:Gfo/Idh/MocA family oxidoreductase [Aestuariicoccus sp. MJ-SS9]MDU8910245.1 Gfo/Idh/MocA family oxidoreductase [Aestuariicoccus sp. MJ-SS9]